MNGMANSSGMHRAAFAAAIIAVTLLAGCTSPDPTESQTSGPPASVGSPRLPTPVNVTFAAPSILGAVALGAEPSIAIAPDGTAYVATPGGLWKSVDGGATWTQLGEVSCPAGVPSCPGLESYDAGVRGGGDSDLYIDPAGRLHWLGLNDGDNAIPYQMSDDHATTWSDVEALEDGGDGGDREWITGRGDTVYAAWRNFPQAGDAMITMRASTDRGMTWGPIHNVTDDTRQGGIAADPSSPALALASDLAGTITVSRSFDDGVTWNHTVVVEDAVMGQIFPVLAYDANGTLYLVYSHDVDGTGVPTNPAASTRPLETPSVYMAVSHDKGVTWTEPVQVNAPGTTAWFPWLAAGSAGRLVVVWYQNDDGMPRQTATDVYVMAAVSLDADRPDPTFALARADPDPVHTGPECRETPGLCTRSLLDFFEVAIHPDGYPIVTYGKATWPVPRGAVNGVEVRTAIMATGPNLLA